MPLNAKGTKIMSSMQEQYGSEKGKSVFYASRNAGTIKGVDKTTVTHSRQISPELGRTTVTTTNDATNTVDSWFRDFQNFQVPPAGTRENQTPALVSPMAKSPNPVKAGDQGAPGGETGALPVPERHDDLLGEVSRPESTPRGPMTEAKSPERTGKSEDAKKAKDQSSTFLPVQSGAPMNNLGTGIPAPNVSGHPGTSKSTSTGDSLRSMNAANRAFWARKR